MKEKRGHVRRDKITLEGGKGEFACQSPKLARSETKNIQQTIPRWGRFLN